MVEWLVWAGNIAIWISFIAQFLKTLRTGGTRDLSLVMYALYTFGVAAWLIYAIWLWNYPLIALEGGLLPFTGYILYRIIKGRRKNV